MKKTGSSPGKNAKATRHIQAILASKKRFVSDDWGYLGAPSGVDPALVVELWRHAADQGDTLDFMEIWEHFEALTPELRAQIAPFFASSTSLRAELYGAAYMRGGDALFESVRGAGIRLEDIQYFGIKDFKHDRIQKLTKDRAFVDCAIVALHRYLFPEPDEGDADGALMARRLLWGLVSLVVVAGGPGAQEALEAITHRAMKQASNQLAFIAARLKAEAERPHVKNALDRVNGKRKGEPPPLPELTPSSTKNEPPPPQPMEANLRLAILGALAESGKLRLPKVKPKDPYKPDESIRTKVLGLKLAPDDLASLDELIWEAGADIQHLIWEQWDGEDDFFEVTRLDGIEMLPGLRSLELSLANVNDLSPLQALSALEHIEVDGQVADLTPLRKLPKLKSVSVSADKTAENKRVVAELRARKVRVTRELG